MKNMDVCNDEVTIALLPVAQDQGKAAELPVKAAEAKVTGAKATEAKSEANEIVRQAREAFKALAEECSHLRLKVDAQSEEVTKVRVALYDERRRRQLAHERAQALAEALPALRQALERDVEARNGVVEAKQKLEASVARMEDEEKQRRAEIVRHERNHAKELAALNETWQRRVDQAETDARQAERKALDEAQAQLGNVRYQAEAEVAEIRRRATELDEDKTLALAELQRSVDQLQVERDHLRQRLLEATGHARKLEEDLKNARRQVDQQQSVLAEFRRKERSCEVYKDFFSPRENQVDVKPEDVSEVDVSGDSGTDGKQPASKDMEAIDKKKRRVTFDDNVLRMPLSPTPSISTAAKSLFSPALAFSSSSSSSFSRITGTPNLASNSSFRGTHKVTHKSQAQQGPQLLGTTSDLFGPSSLPRDVLSLKPGPRPRAPNDSTTFRPGRSLEGRLSLRPPTRISAQTSSRPSLGPHPSSRKALTSKLLELPNGATPGINGSLGTPGSATTKKSTDQAATSTCGGGQKRKLFTPSSDADVI